MILNRRRPCALLPRRYVSHSSGGGYPKLQVQNNNSIRSFTMSVDRGFLGVPSKVSVSSSELVYLCNPT